MYVLVAFVHDVTYYRHETLGDCATHTLVQHHYTHHPGARLVESLSEPMTLHAMPCCCQPVLTRGISKIVRSLRRYDCSASLRRARAHMPLLAPKSHATTFTPLLSRHVLLFNFRQFTPFPKFKRLIHVGFWWTSIVFSTT
jgi:hypothetical protein